MGSPPIATVVIATRNRREDLAVAIHSALRQTVQPEILVLDDGSTDGTSDMVRSEFPSVRLERTDHSLGYIAQRNRGAELAGAPIIVSIDDDAAFSGPGTVEQTVAAFDEPRIGAVAIPYIDVRKSQEVRQSPPTDGRYFVHSYVGTAHAVRRDVFLRLAGYRTYLFHQGEEADLCVRMLDAGYFVRLVQADPIHHFESPKRSFERMDLFGRRNDILYAWHNVPMPYLVSHLVGTTINGIRLGLVRGRLGPMLRGMAKGYVCILERIAERQPVRRSTYRLTRILKKRGPLLADDLPPEWQLER